MKEIVILVNTLRSGGAEKQSIYLLNALNDNYKTYFIVFHGERIEDKIIELISDKNYKLILLKGSYISRIVDLYKILKLKNITHLFTYLTKPNFLGSIIGKLAGVQFIYTGIRISELKGWKLVLEKFSTNYLSTSTIINNYIGKSYFENNGLKKIIVIPNCYPIIQPFKDRPQNNTIKIISVGRFVEEKDYETAIRSICELKKHFSNFIYQIIGYGILEKKIIGWIDKYEMNDTIEILINPNNIAYLLHEADIYLSTSILEGTSNSIMEAMDASLPIVATNVGDNNKMIFHNINGFLHEIGDYLKIAKSMEKLVTNYDLRMKFGYESNRILEENYSFNKFQKSYKKLIEKI